MDFEKIQYFLALAENLNYTKAAQQLFISQSMLSRHIIAMEEEIGMPLFVRNSHGVALTSAGTFMKNALKNISIEYETAIKRAQIIDKGLSGELRIGIISATGLLHLKKRLKKYERLRPDVKIILSIVESPLEITQGLEKNYIDIGFGMPILPLLPSLSSMKVCNSKVLLVMSKDHPLAKTKPGELGLADLKHVPFITPVNSISTAYVRLIERCLKVGFMPEVITVPDIMVTMLDVEINRGVTFIHDFSMLQGNPELVYYELNDIDVIEPFNAYWVSNNSDPKLLAFLDYLKDESQG